MVRKKRSLPESIGTVVGLIILVDGLLDHHGLDALGLLGHGGGLGQDAMSMILGQRPLGLLGLHGFGKGEVAAVHLYFKALESDVRPP